MALQKNVYCKKRAQKIKLLPLHEDGMKSERLKKLEAELSDLEQWMRLGLVPKKEIERHKEEIENLRSRIKDERERLQILKESGELEEYTAPKRGPTKAAFAETPTMSDIEITEEAGETDVEMETTETMGAEETKEEVVEVVVEEEEEDDPFSDKNRWKRGGIIDPDASEW